MRSGVCRKQMTNQLDLDLRDLLPILWIFTLSSNKGLGHALIYLNLCSVSSFNKPKALGGVQILSVELKPEATYHTFTFGSHVISISKFRPQAKPMTRTNSFCLHSIGDISFVLGVGEYVVA